MDWWEIYGVPPLGVAHTLVEGDFVVKGMLCSRAAAVAAAGVDYIAANLPVAVAVS